MKSLSHWLLALLLLLSPLYAGSNEAVITGKTASGRTELRLEVADIDGVIRAVTLTIDGKTYQIQEDPGHHQFVVRDQENGVYFLTIEDADHLFRLWMIPETEKVIKKGNGVYKSRFAAVIEATDPRKDDKWTLSPRITIGCELNYEL